MNKIQLSLLLEMLIEMTIGCRKKTTLETKGFWNINKYDELNRLVKMGLTVNSTSRATHQSNSDNDINYPVLNNAEVMQENYYTWRPLRSKMTAVH